MFSLLLLIKINYKLKGIIALKIFKCYMINFILFIILPIYFSHFLLLTRNFLIVMHFKFIKVINQLLY